MSIDIKYDKEIISFNNYYLTDKAQRLIKLFQIFLTATLQRDGYSEIYIK